MTNKFANWERLEAVISWTGMTINSFALYIGLGRSDSLYHIKRGSFGISHDLADRITSRFPDVDRTWLLTGIGSMLNGGDAYTGAQIPYYKDEVEKLLLNPEEIKPSGYIYLPYTHSAEIVARSLSRAMCDVQCAATDLFLTRYEVEQVVQGNEYVLQVGNQVLWRKVRFVAGEVGKWRLVARDREEYPDMIVDCSDIRQVWRVIARLAVMSS